MRQERQGGNPQLPDRLRLLLLLVLLLPVGCILGQRPSDAASSLRDKTVAVVTVGQLIDTLSVVPASLRIQDGRGRVLGRETYRLDGRFLSWRELPATDSVRLQYRVLSFALDEVAYLLDTNRLQRNEAGILIGSYDIGGGNGTPFADDGKVRYSGAFSRGLSFGNRQDLVLNSSFNLQMNGEIGDGILVTAAITDDNLPIQAEGNTQQLREFDKIFIQLEKDNNRLIAGDYELREVPGSYFLRFNKKLEGATFQTRQKVSENGTINGRGSVAVSRGQFARQPIVPGEGNQGPYRLTGDGNQRFLIVLAGTERIFLDGQLLQRGQDADYTIDYNQGELTFTPRRLITKDSRIVAEYEYADQRYLRSLYATDATFTSGRWSASVNLLSQQDSKNATGDLDLSPAQRQVLSELGDQPGGALVSSIDTLTGPAEQRATYALVDTLVDCTGSTEIRRVLVYDTNPLTGRYVAVFSDLGAGGGDYELANDLTANERVYRYVAPDPLTCQPQGRYAPAVRLVPPEQLRILTAGGGYDFGESRGGIRAEIASSNLDRNRFSRIDSDDDGGLAGRIDADRSFRIGKSDSTAWTLRPTAYFEYVERTFQTLAPYRSPEFLRDWNLANALGINLSTERREESLGGAGVELSRPDWGSLTYNFDYFRRGASYLGQRQSGRLALDRAGWQLLAEGSYLDSREENGRGRLIKPRAIISKELPKFGNWRVSLTGEAERSERFGPADTLLASSFYFQRYGAGIHSPDEGPFTLGIDVRRRQDFSPQGQLFNDGTLANEVITEASYQPTPDLRIGGNFTYRSLLVQDRELTTETGGETFLGRVDVTAQIAQGLLRTQTSYLLGSGQEPRVQFTYLFVGAGQGQYIWQDSLYNNDGRIQPNEMELSPFPDIADYVRVSVFTDDFIRTDNAQLNQSVQFDPGRVWRGEVGQLKKLVRRFNLQSSVNINRKTREAESVQAWNPLQLAISDTTLVSLSAGTRHALFFNRTNTKYDLQLEQSDQRRRNVLTTGYEANRRQEWKLSLRYRPNPALSTRLESSTGQRSADSEFFDAKDFEIDFWRLEPKLDWQPGEDIRLDVSVALAREENVLAEGLGENSLRREAKVEANFRRWLTARIEYVDIELDGRAGSPVGFALLNGLQPGRNYLWNLSATRQLGKYLQVNLTYEGRQTGEAKTVHVGRAQVTALF